MQLNRKTAALLSIGALIGTAGVVGLQTHAQQAPTTTPTAQVQSVTKTTPATPSADGTTPQDTDNVQDQNGPEHVDATGTEVEAPGTETKDDAAEVKDTTPDVKNSAGQDVETQD